MSNFVNVGDSQYIINLDLVAYVDDAPKTIHGSEIDAIDIYFVAQANTDFGPDSMSIRLFDEDAEKFLAALYRQTATW